METLTYRVQIEPLAEGGYQVQVPALPGCVTWGRSYEEAVAMARDAIEGYLFSLRKGGEAIPVERQPHEPFVLGLQVRMPAGA